MPHRFSLTAIVFLFITAALPRPAHADRIAIQSGTIEVTGFAPGGYLTAPISLKGTRGFSFEGVGTETSSVDCVCDPAVQPGEGVALFARWGGPSFRGTATLDGITYPAFETLKDVVSMGLEVSTAFDMPADPGDSFTINTTFDLIGRFWFGPFGPDQRTDRIYGRGRMTSTFARETPGTGRFDPVTTVYSFEPLVFTPEPGTLVLVGTGVALGAVKGRQRRRARLRPEV